MMTQAFGRQIKNPRKIMVRAHMAHMNLPERSFMRSALDEMRPEIREAFTDAIAEVMKP